jgi:hypothetical protein
MFRALLRRYKDAQREGMGGLMFPEYLARDRDLDKGREPKIPSKYLGGLKGKEREERKRELERRMREGGSYEPLPSDEGAETRPSKYTRSEVAKRTRALLEKRGEGASFLRAVSDVSGVGIGILRKVHRRGAEAWASGHRPGATQVAWARARVYSFVSGGKTQKTTDRDLWEEHLKAKRSKG